MTGDRLNRLGLLVLLHKKVRLYKNQSELARAIGISRSHMSRVMRGDKPIDGKVLKWMGYRPVTLYERKR